MDIILYPPIINMSRSELYQTALNLADELGLDMAPLRRNWRRSTTEYWRNEITEYRRNIRNRNNNFNRALRLSREMRVPLSIPAAVNGTDVSVWRREVRRIRMANRRNPRINRLAPVLPQLQRNVAEREIRRDYDRLINRRAYQQIFNQILSDETTLTPQQATRLFNELTSQTRYQVRLVWSGVERFIPVNETTRDFIISILTNGFVVEEGRTYGSDVLDNININDISTFELIRLNQPNHQINRDGRFFPYINTTNLDLSIYQIFNQDQTKELKNREHCLLHTLNECGIASSLINEIKLSHVEGCNFRKKDLKLIPDIIKQNITLHELKPCGKIKKTVIGKFDVSINIALHSSHFFKFDTTPYSRYFINNYEELKDIDEGFRIVKVDGRKSDEYKINSLHMVDKLLKNGYFKALDMSNFQETASHSLLKDHVFLDNIEEEQQEKEVKDIKINDKSIYYADCESFVYDNEKEHRLYLLGVVGETDDYVKIYNVMDGIHAGRKVSPTQDMIYEFLNKITKYGKKDALVYFHNLKYDYHLLEPYINIKNRCEKDNSLYSVVIKYKKREIEFRDSYKLIPFALHKFQKEFDLEKKYDKKEAICYEYYREDNNEKECKVETYRELLSYEDRKIFDKNMRTEPTYNFENKTFNPTSYYKDYLRLDCLVLKKGLQRFNNLIMEITNMSIYDSLTISSLTDKYMIKMGAYEGVYEVKGNLRAYIAKAVYGGRVCVNEKYKKKVIEGKISDYDGVSLYPSAINRLCREIGLPQGPAKRLGGENWQNKVYSILTVKITKVNKKQQMPFIAHKGEGSIEYTNEVPENEIVIDSITLQDYINFHKIEYEVIDGVYWDEDVNKKMGEIIQKLFTDRLKFKKTNKALSNVIKLMLNSAYGKTIMKKTNTEIKIVKTSHKRKTEKGEWITEKHTNFNDYVYNNFNTIKSYRRVNGDNFEVESICCDNTYNRGHIGCAILSMSKRIMNEVFNVANDNNYPIYYTDTDSLHCNLEDVVKLEEKYEERYGKILNGKQLEQFHTDFDLDGACGEIYATKSIFLGKKSYIDVLESVDENGNKIHGHHIRLKGITEEGLQDASKKYDNGYFGLYEDLAKGNEVKIILNPYNESENSKKVLFEFGKGTVSTKKEFIRSVKF